jgi:DNA-binding protein HU-beta
MEMTIMADTVSKAQFIDNIAEKLGTSKTEAEAFVKAYQEEITSTLAGGHSVTFVGFGTFSVGDRAARDGRNPKTGETIRIPASKSAKFKAGKALKDAVNK